VARSQSSPTTTTTTTTTGGCPAGNVPTVTVGGVSIFSYNITTYKCDSCTGSTPKACLNGGCYPGDGYTQVGYCAAGSAAATCAYCPSSAQNGNYDCTTGIVTCSPYGTGTSGTSSSTSSCFSGSESLTLISGETVSMDQVKIGDQVQVASFDGKMTTFSPVIAIPHPRGNSEKASFVHLTTETGRDIRMTGDHLVMSGVCGATVNSLKVASSLKPTDCLMTIAGEEVITTVTSSVSTGVYTVVTAADGLLVVNGVIASPFASNHLIANALYNVHRALYKFAPVIVSHPTMAITIAKVMQAFGNLMIRASRI